MKELQRLKDYAKENNIPIMEEEGLNFLLQLIDQNKVKRILEIGSAIGYSAICMALKDKQIKITTIERDELRYHEAIKNIRTFQLTDQIELIHADALEYETKDKYNLIFIDAAKAQYIKFFERYSPNLAEDGIILSDNLSFHGFVDNQEVVLSRNVRQLVRKIKNYVDYLKENETFISDFYDIGDGLAITKHKKDAKSI